jgi:hypothetical protein
VSRLLALLLALFSAPRPHQARIQAICEPVPTARVTCTTAPFHCAAAAGLEPTKIPGVCP